MKRTLIVLAILVLVGVAVWYYFSKNEKARAKVKGLIDGLLAKVKQAKGN